MTTNKSQWIRQQFARDPNATIDEIVTRWAYQVREGTISPALVSMVRSKLRKDGDVSTPAKRKYTKRDPALPRPSQVRHNAAVAQFAQASQPRQTAAVVSSPRAAVVSSPRAAVVIPATPLESLEHIESALDRLIAMAGESEAADLEKALRRARRLASVDILKYEAA